MIASLLINVQPIWYTEPPDASICSVCKDVICSDVHKVVMQIGEVADLNFVDTNINICKSCYELWQSL